MKSAAIDNYPDYQPVGFSETIFKERYALTLEETWKEACERVSRQNIVAELPERMKHYEKKFYDILVKNLFVPGGRIWYNSGRNNPQLLNCFLLGNNLDSKEGWGNIAREMIITSMTGGGCGIDYSDVRPEGAEIHSQRGTCPGPVELMELVNGCGEPVRAGGARRVALMFSLDLDHPDVLKFLDYKLVQGRLQLANVSVRSKNTTAFISAVKKDEPWILSWKGKYKKQISAKELWNTITKNAYDSAEPGFLNWELVEEENTVGYIEELTGVNPCQPGFATVLTPEGITTFDDIDVGSTIWSGSQWTRVINKVATGNKEVYKYVTNAGYFLGTENHRVVQEGIKVEVKDAETIDISTGPRSKIVSNFWRDQEIIDGWVLGDGSVHKASNNLVFLCLGKNDEETFLNRFPSYIIADRRKAFKFGWEVKTNITSEQLVKTYERRVPQHILQGDRLRVCSFLRGLYSANGSICGNRVTLKASSRGLIEDVQEMLSSVGISSYITTNKAHTVEFENGEYECKESYDLNIRKDIRLFEAYIGFEHQDKMKRLCVAIGTNRNNRSKTSYGINNVEFVGVHPVYDITVDADEHTYWSGGCLVSNCGEVVMPPYDSCCLGHIVLSRFVKEDGSVDWPALAETTRLGVRFLDNIKEVNCYPLKEMKEVSDKYRRIGLGVTGLADMLILAGFKYGSSEGIKFIDKLFRFISKQAYEASVMLSIEKGMFPVCRPDQHIETGFVKRMPHKIRSWIAEHGIRNAAILTCAPTGTVSILSGNCSSGIEPIFAPAYERRWWDVDKRQTELVVHPLFKQFLEEGKSLDNFVSSRDLSVRDHMEVQAIVQKHIDNSVSKTINIPEDYPQEEVAEAWLEYLPRLKGTTFYRENSRGYVDKDGKLHEPPLKAFSVNEAIEQMNKKGELEMIVSSEVDCIGGVCEI